VKAAVVASTVGLTGEFDNLDLALRTLLAEGRRDICICLLPGNHNLADSLSLTGSTAPPHQHPRRRPGQSRDPQARGVQVRHLRFADPEGLHTGQ
jgi:hypothetical protein